MIPKVFGGGGGGLASIFQKFHFKKKNLKMKVTENEPKPSTNPTEAKNQTLHHFISLIDE